MLTEKGGCLHGRLPFFETQSRGPPIPALAYRPASRRMWVQGEGSGIAVDTEEPSRPRARRRGIPRMRRPRRGGAAAPPLLGKRNTVSPSRAREGVGG